MYSKRKMCCLIATCSLLVCMFRAEVFAKENEQQELPEIIRWEEGRGFDEQGEQIVGSWAYDTVNVEGKYVLFDDMGNVTGNVCRKFYGYGTSNSHTCFTDGVFS